MPLYEYVCEQCADRFELIRKFSDPPLDACPKCGGPVRKLFSSPAIQFKGSGWYITDYAKKSSGDAAQAAADKGSAEKADSGGKSESDSKPDSGKTDSSKTDAASKPAATSAPASSDTSSAKPSTTKAE
jgi:putative FmdB family regulatory protein